MAADTFKLKRGTTAAVNAYLPEQGEPVYDITLKQLKIGDGVTLGGVVPSNAFTADKLTTARDITLSGSVTGIVSFDGSANVTINTSVGTSLQTVLDSKAPLASPALTGTPTVPTAAVDTNTTQAASTAFVVGQAGADLPIVDGTASAGVSLRYSRVDHVHPTDTSRAPLASPTFTGTPAAPTASAGTNTTQLATTAFVTTAVANASALANTHYLRRSTTTAQATTASTDLVVSLATVDSDPVTMATSATISTVKKAGLYLLQAVVRWNGSSTDVCTQKFFINGVALADPAGISSYTGSAGIKRYAVNLTVFLNVNDTIELVINPGTAASGGLVSASMTAALLN